MRRNGLKKYDAPLRYSLSGATKPLKKASVLKLRRVSLLLIAVWIGIPCSIVSGYVDGIQRSMITLRGN